MSHFQLHLSRNKVHTRSLGGYKLHIAIFYHFLRLIKLASTKLNYLIGIGAIVLYLDTIFFVIPSTDPGVVTVFCNLTPWLTAIGYSLCYGTILAKMARVYYIFNNPSTNKKVCVWDISLYTSM